MIFHSEEGEIKGEDSGTLRDISSGGALICHKNAVTKKTLLYVSTELPDAGSIKMQPAEVKNLRKNTKNEY